MTLSVFSTLSQISKLINLLQSGLAGLLRWLILLMALVVCAIVVARYFDLGSIALQESVTYMHGTVFMLCLAYTAGSDGHVRVDIIYRRLNEEHKAWVNLLGSCLFLLPFALFLAAISWQAAVQSWALQEGSINSGGLPLVFLLKTLTPCAGILLALHACADICLQLTRVSWRTK